MKTLIVYYSFSGNNRVLAQYLQERLQADLVEVVERDNRTGFTILLDVLFRRTPRLVLPDIAWEQYDRVLLLAPIWNGRIANPLKAFLRETKNKISRYSFVSVCGNGHNKKIAAELDRLVGHPPALVAELPVNDLLPPERKNKVRHTSGYRIQEADLAFFGPALEKVLAGL